MKAKGKNKRMVRLVRTNTAHQALGFGSDVLDGLDHTCSDAMWKELRKNLRGGNQKSITKNERDDSTPQIAARKGNVEKVSMLRKTSCAHVDIGQKNDCKPLDLVSECRQINAT